MSDLIRSWLYCPAHQPELLAKALNSDADAVVIDFEDAVPVGAKARGREGLAAALALPTRAERWVRINALDSAWAADDLEAVTRARPDGVRIAKCESVDDIRRWADSAGLPVALIIETALGLERVFELASAHPLVVGVSLGETDLRASLRADGDQGLDWARGRVVVAARAAGLSSPPQSVYTQVADSERLRVSTERARDSGFFGRSVIHPRQIDIVNSVFTPTPEQVAAARATLALLEGAEAHDRAAVLDSSGAFVDPAVTERAAAVVQLHSQLQKKLERR